jgi:hypothetical protein
MKKTTKKKDNKLIKLEDEYRKLFPLNNSIIIEHKSSFVQPHVLKVVRSVVTYAAYEDPI